MLYIPLSTYYLHSNFLAVGIVNSTKDAQFDVYDVMSWQIIWRSELSETFFLTVFIVFYVTFFKENYFKPASHIPW